MQQTPWNHHDSKTLCGMPWDKVPLSAEGQARRLVQQISPATWQAIEARWQREYGWHRPETLQNLS
jgi:hypothetical protein